ncbi:hypothetical protein ONQ62_28730, partial [Salmonella enterica subsp. enterica serovar Virginia]|nr:hypothetical protein [Salmonella enterica subsp. enterica serovar Virginia]
LADRDVDLDGIYYCPHHPQGSIEEFRQVCDCRKPHPGMLISASTAFALRGLFEAQELFASAVVCGALTTEAVLGSRRPFDARI